MAVSLPSNPRDEEVDMAPMIDMVFLLLVFFMVSSHMQSEDYVKLDIPLASSAKVPEDRSDRVVVSVEQDGKILLGVNEIKADVLTEVLKERNDAFMALAGGDNRLKIVIRGHADTEHGEIKKVMRSAADAGIVDVIFATHEDLD